MDLPFSDLMNIKLGRIPNTSMILVTSIQPVNSMSSHMTVIPNIVDAEKVLKLKKTYDY